MELFAAELQAAADPRERSRLLLSYAATLAPLAPADKRDANRVMGCTAQVGVAALRRSGCWGGGGGGAAGVAVGQG